MEQRVSRILLLAAGLAAVGCEEGSGPSDGPGEVSVRVTTIGLDLDLNGYRVLVESVDRGAISSNGTTLIRLDPGTYSVALASLEANCSVDGPDSRDVPVADDESAQVDFKVVCTARSGVIGVVVNASGTRVDGAYAVDIDGVKEFPVRLQDPAFVSSVAAGDHVVSLDTPHNCQVENSPQSVTVTAGGLIRDTAVARFAVTCGTESWNVRITATTTGVVPPSTRYRVMHETFGYWDYDGPVTELGLLEPNGTLVALIEAGSGANYWHRFYLGGVPSTCSVNDPHPYPNPGFTIPAGGLDVEFEVLCSP